MRTWVIKPEYRDRKWPDDMMVVEVEGDMLLYIQHDGKWDLSHADCGYPTAHMFDVFEAEG